MSTPTKRNIARANPYQWRYAVVWYDVSTPGVRTPISVAGPYSLEQAHATLSNAARSQHHGQGREYRAAIVPVGSPFGDNPWTRGLEQAAEW